MFNPNRRMQPDDLDSLIQLLLDQRNQIGNQLDNIQDKLERSGKEQQERHESLRREMLTMFVTRTEYDPKHQILVDQNRETRERLVSLETKANDQNSRLNTIENSVKRVSNRPATIMYVLTVILSVVSLAVSIISEVASHLSFR